MRSKIVFFSNNDDSLEGTKRGFITFIVIAILETLYVFTALKLKFYKFDFKYNKQNLKNCKVLAKILPSIFIIWLLLCSALSVLEPNCYPQQAMYSSLVGLVVYGVFSYTAYIFINGYSFNNLLIDIIVGTFICWAAGSLLYLTYWKNNFLRGGRYKTFEETNEGCQFK